jgi:hypothetical protein
LARFHFTVRAPGAPPACKRDASIGSSRWLSAALSFLSQTFSPERSRLRTSGLAREAGNRSGQYLANTVLFATVLFFAGTAGKFEQPRVRLSAAAFAVAVFIFAVVRMLLMPAA